MKSLIIFTALFFGIEGGYVPHDDHATSYASVVRHDHLLKPNYDHVLPNNLYYNNLYHNDHANYDANANYEYKYGVKDLKTGDVKDAWESRHGGVVKGSYTLKEADGTTRVVDYTADDHNGFNAVVKKLGHAYNPHEVYGHEGVAYYKKYDEPHYW